LLWCPAPPLVNRPPAPFTWPLQDIISRLGWCARITHPCIIAPPRLHCPHGCNILLHDYWAVNDPPSELRLYAIHCTILVITISCKTINRSHAHRTHRQRKHPRHRHTHAHDKNPPPNEHLPQALNNARRWRDDGVYCEGQPLAPSRGVDVLWRRHKGVDVPVEVAQSSRI